MLRIFEKPGHVIKLNRSLYGMRQLPLNFFLCLKKALEHRGFEQSKLDSCLLSNGQVICLVYVDDCLFFSKRNKDINAVIQDLKKPARDDHTIFLLEEENDVAGFLGILFEKVQDSRDEIC